MSNLATGNQRDKEVERRYLTLVVLHTLSLAGLALSFEVGVVIAHAHCVSFTVLLVNREVFWLGKLFSFRRRFRFSRIIVADFLGSTLEIYCFQFYIYCLSLVQLCRISSIYDKFQITTNISCRFLKRL